MAQTTSASSACDVKVELDDSTGALIDISGMSNSMSMGLTNNISGGTYTFGSECPLRFECGQDSTISANILYSTTADEGFDILKDWYFGVTGGARSIRISVPDATTNSDQYDVEVYLAEMTWDMTAGDPEPIMVAVTFTPTGCMLHTMIGS